MDIQPYLFFEGCCEEAINFYKTALGAKVDAIMHYKDSPHPVPEGMVAPGSEGKVMHAAFRIGGSTVMATDGRCSGNANFSGFSLTLNVADEAEADRCFNALAEGGEVKMPLGKTFFSPKFGMVNDRFGIGWMVNVAT